MKKLIIILLLLSSCAWNKQDKILYVSYLTLSAIDAIQTSQESQKKQELNMFMRNSNGNPDMKKVAVVKVLSGMGVYFAADYFSKIRRPLLIGANVLQGGVVLWSLQYDF